MRRYRPVNTISEEDVEPPRPSYRRWVVPFAAAAIVLSSISIVNSLSIMAAAREADFASTDSSTSPAASVAVADAVLPPPPPNKTLCNPYHRPGRLVSDSQLWIPTTPLPSHCLDRPVLDHTSLLLASTRDPTRPLPPHLHNKLMLIVSDSNDRNTVDSLCELIEGRLTAVLRDGTVIPQELVSLGDARICVVRPGISPNAPPPAVPLNIPGSNAFGSTESANAKADGVFVIMYSFSYGLGLDDGDTRPNIVNQIRPGDPWRFEQIVDNLPRLINALAPVHFPELINTTPPTTSLSASTTASTASADSTAAPHVTAIVTPTLILSQSSIWELLYWRLVHLPSNPSNMPLVCANSLQWGFSRLPRDFRSIYLHSFHKAFPGVPLAWRSCPPAGATLTCPERIATYNMAMREIIREEGSGVRFLDWFGIVVGRFWEEDYIHQDERGKQAYAQMYLTELEYMWASEMLGDGRA